MCRRALRLVVTLCLFGIMTTVLAAKTQPSKPSVPSKSENSAKPENPPKPVEPLIPAPDRITAEQVDEYIKYYSGLGQHRAGSKIDNRCGKWIETTLKRDKLNVTRESYTFNRPESRYAVVSMKIDYINSVILPGMPLLNAKPTNVPINTKLGFLGQEGTVPVIFIYVTPPSGKASLRAKSIKEFNDAIESGKYPAVIGVTEGGYAGLVPLSIDLNKQYKTPAMLMSSELGNFAEIYAEINNPVKFLTRLQYHQTTADNIVAKIEGTNPSLAPIVVIVPRSAWWYAAAERGTSLAAVLASAKALVKTPQPRTIYFVMTTGQEFYSLGEQKFLQAHPDLLKQAYAWIYVGGNVGTKPQPHFILQGSSREMRREVHRAFEQYGIEQLQWMDPQPILLPPLAPAFDHSDHAVIIAATNNRCERMICDKWPENVNVDATVKFSKALTKLIQELAAGN